MQAVCQCACVPFNRRGGVSGGQQSFIRASVVTCLWWRLCQTQRRKRMINGLVDPEEKEGQNSIFGEGKCQQDNTVCVAESRLIHLRCWIGRTRRRRCNLSVLRCASSRVERVDRRSGTTAVHFVPVYCCFHVTVSVNVVKHTGCIQ